MYGVYTAPATPLFKKPVWHVTANTVSGGVMVMLPPLEMDVPCEHVGRLKSVVYQIVPPVEEVTVTLKEAALG